MDESIWITSLSILVSVMIAAIILADVLGSVAEVGAL